VAAVPKVPPHKKKLPRNINMNTLKTASCFVWVQNMAISQEKNTDGGGVSGQGAQENIWT
jgi:hypothetical protein